MKEYLEKRLEELKSEYSNQLSKIGNSPLDDDKKNDWEILNKAKGGIEEIKKSLNYLATIKEN